MYRIRKAGIKMLNSQPTIQQWNSLTDEERAAWVIQATPTERLDLGLAVTSDAWQKTKEVLALENPHLGAEEINILYIRQKYGEELAAKVRAELENRRRLETA
jgi:hypothetical protein